MQAPKWANKAPLSMICFALLAIAASLAIVESDQSHPSDDRLAAYYSRGNLKVTIPYHTTRSGAGELSVDVLSPADEVLAHMQKQVILTRGDGAWHEALHLSNALPLEDLIW